SAELSIEAGIALSVVALGTADDLQASVFEDEVSAVTETSAVISVLNAIPDSTISLGLGNGETLADGIEFNTVGDPVALDPISDFSTLSFTVDGQSQDVALPVTNFYGGNYINAIAVLDTSGVFPQPRVIFAE